MRRAFVFVACACVAACVEIAPVVDANVTDASNECAAPTGAPTVSVDEPTASIARFEPPVRAPEPAEVGPCPSGVDTVAMIGDVETLPHAGTFLRGERRLKLAVGGTAWSVFADTPLGTVGGVELRALQLSHAPDDTGREGGAIVLVNRVPHGDCLLGGYAIREGVGGEEVRVVDEWFASDQSIAVFVLRGFASAGESSVITWTAIATDGSRVWQAVPEVRAPRTRRIHLDPRDDTVVIAIAAQLDRPAMRFEWDWAQRAFVPTLR
jgi:hypothetical protein